MSAWKSVLGQILALLLLGWILIGALWTATAEIRPRPLEPRRSRSPQASVTQERVVATPFLPAPTTLPRSPSPTQPPTVSPSPTPSVPAPTPLPSPTRTPCRPPADWAPYRVQPGDTAFRLATLAGISLPRFLEANCLRGPALFIGQRVYLPVRLPTSTPNPTPCGPPSDWELYTVQPGETLYRLAARFQVPLYLLMHANCLTSPVLTAGQPLYVPPRGTPTPTGIPIPTETPTASP
ncbi:LysM peptidoglycan-binding domain-containing protein [Thermoflexus sp.]|uniref:LysM peptidoglycan-binding domain-containing protein n=1 Tax=Thermoflexus sp. TaxID=1969742 RepID=UPI0035E3FD6D